MSETTYATTESRFARFVSLEGLGEVMAMAGPMVLGAMSYTIMEFVDKVMVSRLGPDSLAAVGSSGLWAYTLSTLMLGMVGCVSTFVAQSYGKGDKDMCAKVTWQGIYLGFAMGLVALLLIPLARPLFATMNHTESVTNQEVIYFQVRVIGYAAIAWQAALAAFFQSISRPAIPMFVAFFANFLNIVLDYLLIFGNFGFPRWEIAGAAAATVIAITVQGLILQVLFMSSAVNREYKSRKTLAVDRRTMWDLMRIGFPAGLASFVDVANWAIFTSFIVGGLGTVALAAQTAAINFMHFTFIPIMGLMFATQAVVGQWIGRGDIRAAKIRAYTAMKLAVAFMIVMGIIMATFGGPLIELAFSKDPEIVKIGANLLILAAIFAGFDGLGIISMGALRGAGDTKWIMIVTFFGTYGLSLPLAYTLTYPVGWGAEGAWVGATIYIIFLGFVLLHRFHGEKWRHIKIFTESKEVEGV